MVVNLEVLTDVSKPDKKGNPVIIMRDASYFKQFDTIDMLVENYLNPKGKIVKKYCIVKTHDAYYKINQKYEEVIKLTAPIKFIIIRFMPLTSLSFACLLAIVQRWRGLWIRKG